jgi:rhodanese-related sulfurtransferase
MSLSQSIDQITVKEFETRLESSDESLQLVDVREPDELAIAHLDGFINLPLSQFGEWSDDIHNRLNSHRETIVMCHHGMRSAQMCQWLIHQGFTQVRNLTGGIDAYSVQIDPTVPRY